MATPRITRHALGGVATLVALGFGCGGNGGGCGAGQALPADPAPWGFPMDEAIEGGMQARVTRPGFDKLSSVIPALAAAVLPSMASPICMGEQQQALKILGTGGDVRLCNGPCAAGIGCPAWIDLRPDLAPPGGIGVSVPDGPNPVASVDAAFDVHLLMPIQHRLCFFGICQGWQDDCTMHIDSPGTHIQAGVPLGIDPVSGRLTIALGNVVVVGLNLGFSNCGLLGDIFDLATTVINAVAGNFISDTLVGLIQPQLAQAVAGLVPNPPGLASRLDLTGPLASFSPPPEAALEVLAVAGGYVAGSGGGLNLGVLAGVNSDRNPSTRGPSPAAINSEPSLCVPARPTYDLGKAPFSLPEQPDRKDHLLDPAPAFAGAPDPLDAAGNVQDVALGVSRTFLDELGFHLYNSGSLCLRVGEGLLGGRLNGGTLRVLAPSVANIVTDPQAAVFLVVRPEQPPLFTLGAGGANDPLLKINATDLRIDLYTFVEERYVRLLTLALDLQLGLDLTFIIDANGQPAIAPVLGAIKKGAVQIRAQNTDLISEPPAELGSALSVLVEAAVGQLGGALSPVALPSVMGLSLDGLTLSRVQAAQDDFLAIGGDITQDAHLITTATRLDRVGWRREVPVVTASAELVDVSVPPPEVIAAAVAAGRLDDGDTPSVTVALGGAGDARRLEWSYRIDGGFWRPYSNDPRPTLRDAALLVQARHGLDVRARERGTPQRETSPIAHLDFVIDSLPPDLALTVRDASRTIDLVGRDNVSEQAALRYAWRTAQGFTEPSPRATLGFDEAWAATGLGRSPLTVAVLDEQGNRSEQQLDLSRLPGFSSAPRASAAGAAGCGCRLASGSAVSRGEAARGLAVCLILGALVVGRRSRRRGRDA